MKGIKQNFCRLPVGCLTMVLLLPIFGIAVKAQEKAAANSNQVNADAAPAAAVTPTPIPFSEIVAQAESASASLKELASGISADTTAENVEQNLPAKTEEINAKLEEMARIVEGRPSLESLKNLETEWKTLSKNLPKWNDDLTSRAKKLEGDLEQLNTLEEKWKKMLNELKTSPETPPQVTARIEEIITSTAQIRTQIEVEQSRIVALQSKVAEQQKRVAGVATSIPGVAIAVALMPPLDAIGFGFGIAATSDSVQGLNIARGAGLLILTNLVAIMFSAMLVFLALRVNTEGATEKVKEWRSRDHESVWAKYFLARFPGFDKLRTIGSLPGRFLLILVSLVLISVPLYESFTQLKDEIVQKQEQNRVEDAVRKVWKENFAELPDGRPRGYINNVETSNEDNRTVVQMNILTGQPLSKDERNLYSQNLASRLDIEPEKLDLRFVEIPTTSSEFLAKARKQARENIQSEADKIFTEKQKLLAARIREHSLSGIKDYFKNFELPAPAEFVNYQINMDGNSVPQVNIVYLSSQEIEGNRQIEIADVVQSRLDDPAVKVSFERIEPLVGTVNFDNNQAKLSGAAIALLDLTGQIIRHNPNLIVEISAGKDENESDKLIVEKRTETITNYLASKWQIAADRTISAAAADARRGATLRIKLKQQMPVSTDAEN